MPTTAGIVITGADVEDAVLTHLKTWFQTYLYAIEEAQSLSYDSLPVPRGWFAVNEFDKFPDDQLPTVLVVSPGLYDEPREEGRGRIRARWTIGVGVVVAGPDRDTTRRLSRWYIAAARLAMVQQQSLGGFSTGVNWLSEDYTQLDVEDARFLAAGTANFWVEVTQAGERWEGPGSPVVSPPGDRTYDITEGSVVVDKEDL